MIELACERGIRVIDTIDQSSGWALHNVPAEVGTIPHLWTVTNRATGLALYTNIDDLQMAQDLYQRVVNRMPQPVTVNDYLYCKEILICWTYYWELIDDTAEHIRDRSMSPSLSAHLGGAQ